MFLSYFVKLSLYFRPFQCTYKWILEAFRSKLIKCCVWPSLGLVAHHTGACRKYLQHDWIDKECSISTRPKPGGVRHWEKASSPWDAHGDCLIHTTRTSMQTDKVVTERERLQTWPPFWLHQQTVSPWRSSQLLLGFVSDQDRFYRDETKKPTAIS